MSRLRQSSLTNPVPTMVSLTSAQNRLYQRLLQEVLPDEHGRRLTARINEIADKDKGYLATLRTYRVVILLEDGVTFEIHERPVEVRRAPGQRIGLPVQEVSRLEVSPA